MRRSFDKLIQGVNESVKSFSSRFTDDSDAVKCFDKMTDSQELDKFNGKLLTDVQAQLDLYVTMGMKFTSVEHVCKLIGMMERANGGSQKKNLVNSVNWRKKRNRNHPSQFLKQSMYMSLRQAITLLKNCSSRSVD